MATMTSMPLHQRPKKVVRYGKSSSRSTYSTKHVASFLEDDDLPPAPAPATMTTATRPSVKETYTVQKAESKNTDAPKSLVEKLEPDMGLMKKSPVKHVKPVKQVAPVKPAKAPAKTQDAFDVPSSEDEMDVEDIPTRRVSPPGFKAKRTLVDDTKAEDAQLAPWEKPKPAPKPVVDDTLDKKKSTAAASNNRTRTTRAAKKVEESILNTEQNVTSAAARLAARRQLADSTAPPPTNETATATATSASNKRAKPPIEVTSSSPRKRARKTPPLHNSSEDVAMANAFCAPTCGMPLEPMVAASAETDVFDFPDANEDERMQAKVAVPKPKAITRTTRRGKLSSPGRPMAKKGLSAPARLTEMLPVDTDSTDAPSRSPSVMQSRPSTPRRSAPPARARQSLTPPVRASSSPLSSAKSAGTLTPKQKQLWSQLLSSDPVAPSPSALAMKDLTLSGKKRTAASARSMAPPLVAKSKSDVTDMHRRRTRLVDRLKASAPSSDNELSEEDSDEEMEDVASSSPAGSARASQVVEVQSQDIVTARTSQSQSQPTAAEAGPRVTYARTRSYLPEDNLEDGLMFDLPSMTPQRPPTLARAPSKTNAASQKSAFDMDENEEESAPGRLRTIHELRAAGRNDRFMRETEALLEDIADHNSSARSRRRSALMEVAIKLADKGYAERFVGQGFEHKLVAECSTAPDEIADFALASAFALLLAAEPPQHAITSLKDGGVLDWLAQLLTKAVEVGKMAKDRKNNMAKAAQSTLFDFAKTVQSQQTLWGEAKLLTTSTRLMGLKALDQLVRRLRRQGDKSELLETEHLQHVLATQCVDATDISVSISLLESLSTSALALAWPEGMLERLATLLPDLDKTAGMPTHTLFLAFRLTLNLTNDNTRNCKLFATAKLVHYLLQAIKCSFDKLAVPSSEEQRDIDLDLLVLAMGIMINLAEHNEATRHHTVSAESAPILSALLKIFQQGQKRIEEAESVEESTTNVAFGYLAIMLANVCLDDDARASVTSKLPGQSLEMLIDAVEEFVMHHQKVDMLSFEGEEGREVWGAFTGRLRAVLGKLKGAVGMG